MVESPPYRKVKGRHSLQKANWDDSRTMLLLKLCLNEVEAGNKTNTSFNKVGWKSIVNKFNKKTGCNYSLLQIKNKWNSMRRDWSLWQKLKTYTGVEFDKIGCTLKAEPEWWAVRIQENPEVAKFRHRGPLFADYQRRLFDCIVSHGESCDTPSCGLLPPILDEESPPSNGYNSANENLMHDPSPDPFDSHLETTPALRGNSREPSHSPLETIPMLGCYSEQEPKGTKVKKRVSNGRGSNSEKITRSLEKMDEYNEVVRRRVSYGYNPEHNVKIAMQVLASMSCIEIGSELYCFAAELLEKPVLREVFLSHPNDNARLAWIEYKKSKYEQSSSQASVGGF